MKLPDHIPPHRSRPLLRSHHHLFRECIVGSSRDTHDFSGELQGTELPPRPLSVVAEYLDLVLASSSQEKAGV